MMGLNIKNEWIYGCMDREMTQTNDDNNLTFSSTASTNNQPMTIDLYTAIHVNVTDFSSSFK